MMDSSFSVCNSSKSPNKENQVLQGIMKIYSLTKFIFYKNKNKKLALAQLEYFKVKKMNVKFSNNIITYLINNIIFIKPLFYNEPFCCWILLICIFVELKYYSLRNK